MLQTFLQYQKESENKSAKELKIIYDKYDNEFTHIFCNNCTFPSYIKSNDNHTCDKQYCYGCMINLKNTCPNCDKKIYNSLVHDFLPVKPYDYNAIRDEIDMQQNKQTQECSLCNKNIIDTSYINKTHSCNNEYCENCIIKLKNNCFDCNQKISSFFDNYLFSSIKPKKYTTNIMQDMIKDIIKEEILECDICCEEFTKTREIIYKHPCSIIYCYKCIKKVNNFCKVCKKIIVIEKEQEIDTEALNNMSNNTCNFKGNWPESTQLNNDYITTSKLLYNPYQLINPTQTRSQNILYNIYTI